MALQVGHLFLGLLMKMYDTVPLTNMYLRTERSTTVKSRLIAMLNPVPFILLNLVRSTDSFLMDSRKGTQPDVNVHAT